MADQARERWSRHPHLGGGQVLPGRWGVKPLAIAVPKQRESARAWLNDFLSQQLRDGQVTRAAERAGLRGLAVE